MSSGSRRTALEAALPLALHDPAGQVRLRLLVVAIWWHRITHGASPVASVSQRAQETDATGHERTTFHVGPEREALAHQARERVVEHQDIRPRLLDRQRALPTWAGRRGETEGRPTLTSAKLGAVAVVRTGSDLDGDFVALVAPHGEHILVAPGVRFCHVAQRHAEPNVLGETPCGGTSGGAL